MAYCGYITRIKDLRKHSNADRLQCGLCFGNSVIVGLEVKENDIGLYFPTDGKLGIEFCEANNLLRKKDEQGNNIGGYLEADKRHINSIKLRGEKSDGLFMSLSSLDNFCDISKLKEGDTIDILNKVLICEKYIPKTNRTHGQNPIGKKKKKTTVSYPLFEEHADTSQLVYNIGQFREGDICSITLKQHGTSGRSANTIKESRLKIPHILWKIFKFKPKRTWENISGTRRVVLKNYDNGYYGSDLFRKQWHDFFVGKLPKGMTVYYEIVGYVNESTLIMPECKNSKTKDKEFIKQYGDTTRFTYGCEPGQNDIYVYRMTMTNEDGDSFEIPFDVMKIWCDKLGVKHVLELDKFIFTTKEDLMERVNNLVEGIDPIGKSHIREGVVVRIENREKFSAYKHKGFSFKCLEGIIKEDNILDMEDAEEANVE
jgi:tRNA-binding EMAP/Myf-like protein